MQMKSETQSGLAAQIRIIPAWAWTLAALGFICAQIFFNVVVARDPGAPPAWASVLFGGLLGIVLGAYLLFLGYVNRDARRRGMSAVLWTLVAILIPNGLGILLYFILRQPLAGALPQNALPAGACPRCGYNLNPGCPQCRRPVGVDDSYCRACGTQLHQQAVAAL